MIKELRSKYLRQLPSIGKLMEAPELSALSGKYPHALIVKSLREIIDNSKLIILSSENEEDLVNIDLSPESIIKNTIALIRKSSLGGIRYAINATGDILFGQSPLNESAQRAVNNAIKRYSSDQNDDINEMLSSLTGAESGMITNNISSALMLILNTICKNKEIIISRGELSDDELRLPQIIELSDAELMSIGTTNKTHIKDYEKAISDNTSAILKANRSNFRIAGFTEQVSLPDLVELANKYNLPVIDYMINGCLIDLTQIGFSEEPYIPLSIKNGADLLCFSTERLFGGPQAGVIVGKEKYISLMRQNPLYSIYKPNKIILSAIDGTLKSYMDTEKILYNNLALRFLCRKYDEISGMAQRLFDMLNNNLPNNVIVKMIDGYSNQNIIYVPKEKLRTKLIRIKHLSLYSEKLKAMLSDREIPIYVISDDEYIIIDLRSVWHDEIDEIAKAIMESCL